MALQVDRIITDPIISTENTAFSPSRSRPPIDHFPSIGHPSAEPTERDSLLGGTKVKKPFYRARPLWLVPFALIASVTRGMTLASRVEVFTELSCNRLQEHYNHTSTNAHNTITFFQSESYYLDAPDPQYTTISLPPLPLHEFEGPNTGSDSDGEDDDPRVIPGKKCVSDPAVQAGAARLQTIMTTTMGALSALTTGWWGQFGERHGRTRVLAISTFGLFLTDLTFILVSTPHSPFAAHSHKLLILAPIIEGSLGGWSTLTGANTAYIADCTSPGSRAKVFARFSGVLFVGLSVGPVIGSWFIKHPLPFLRVGEITHPLQTVNSVFWVAIGCSFVNLLLVLFVFPESLPASKRASNAKGKGRAVDIPDVSNGMFDFRKGSSTWAGLRVLHSFLSPLGVFLPTDVPVPFASDSEAFGRKRTRRDWSLTFLAMMLFGHMLASGIFQIKYLYAEHVYDWATEQLSYYISFMGATRAIHLLLLLPAILTMFKPVRAAIAGAASTPTEPTSKPKPTKSHLLAEIRFDLRVIRCSMVLDMLSHTLVVLAPLPSRSPSATWWSQFMFVGATSLACVGAGVMPAVQSLALCTLQGRGIAMKEAARSTHEQYPLIDGEIREAARDMEESEPELEPGKLFGALAVLQAVGQTILGPMVFGLIYSSTVASMPKAIFATAGGLVLVAI
ncbi:major facilitator superfamily-domain-containing protein, partial [Hygrophoropsis aurantiaca]